jgi:hypothetical protein
LFGSLHIATVGAGRGGDAGRVRRGIALLLGVFTRWAAARTAS